MSLLLYGRTIGHPLIWDSKEIIEEDPTIRSLRSIPSYFAGSTNPEISSEGSAVRRLDYYRPIAKTLLALQYALFETSPGGYHATNVGLNAIVVVLFFLLVRSLSGDQTLAFLASLLYSVHPVRGEAVNWVYSFTSPLMGLFALLALLLYIRGRRVGALAAYAAALMSRESAVLLVPVLLVYELAFNESVSWKRRLARLAPSVALALGFLVLRSAILKAPPPIAALALSPGVMANTMAVMVKRLLKIVVWPDAMVAHYLLEDFSALSLEVMVGYLLIGVAAILFAALWRHDRRLAFWFAWLGIWPSIVFFTIGQAGDYLMMEKVLYLGVGGAAVLATMLLSRAPYGRVLLLVLVAAYFSMSMIRLRYWSDENEHLRQVLEFAPDHTGARYTLGTNLGIQGRCDEAIPHLSRVVREIPNHSHALNNLGNCYYALSNLDKAGEHWSRAHRADPTNPMVLYNLGLVAEKRRDYSTALAYYNRYLTMEPNAPPAIKLRIQLLSDITERGTPAPPPRSHRPPPSPRP